MDIQLIGDLFKRCIIASELLEVDEDFRNQLKETLDRLPPMQIGKHGQLQEWLEDLDRLDDRHSHVSHLYGLYPGTQISVKDTPELAKAVERSLEMRGDYDFRAWPAAWRIALHAHLKDGETAHKRLVSLIAASANPNMFNLRPPLPMQIDGNFGGAAGITEMLLQSRARYDHSNMVFELELLPALPAQWAQGDVRGFRARGGFEIDLCWEDGILNKATLHSHKGGKCKVFYESQEVELDTKTGESYHLEFPQS